jgi:hypothetical protein
MPPSVVEKTKGVSVSLLESLDGRGDEEMISPEFTPDNIMDFYNRSLEKVDPRGEESTRGAVMMYGGED